VTLFQKISLVALRITMGWMFFYAGITKVMDPNWSAVGYLKGAKTFVGFYTWLLQPGVLPIVNGINEWGLTLLGISLILGLLVRLSTVLGAVLMLMYYVPILQFPYPNDHAFIVDEHIIYIIALLFLWAIHAGRVWGLDGVCSKSSFCKKNAMLRKLMG